LGPGIDFILCPYTPNALSNYFLISSIRLSLFIIPQIQAQIMTTNL
jgi:hypothetical protein